MWSEHRTRGNIYDHKAGRENSLVKLVPITRWRDDLETLSGILHFSRAVSY